MLLFGTLLKLLLCVLLMLLCDLLMLLLLLLCLPLLLLLRLLLDTMVTSEGCSVCVHSEHIVCLMTDSF